MAYTPPSKSFTPGQLQAPRLETQEPTEYQKSERLKNDRIARSCSLNCAAQTVEAYAHIIAATDMVKTMTNDQIKGWLKSMKQTEFAENLRWITGKNDEEIDF